MPDTFCIWIVSALSCSRRHMPQMCCMIKMSLFFFFLITAVSYCLLFQSCAHLNHKMRWGSIQRRHVFNHNCTPVLLSHNYWRLQCYLFHLAWGRGLGWAACSLCSCRLGLHNNYQILLPDVIQISSHQSYMFRSVCSLSSHFLPLCYIPHLMMTFTERRALDFLVSWASGN